MPSIPPVIPRRKITGMSAVLLPFKNGNVDWECFEAHVTRTLDASLTPAVNMDTGYVNLLDDSTRLEVLSRTQRLTGGRMFVAGAYVSDRQGAAFNSDAYRQRINEIQSADGVPVIFQSWGLTGQSEADIVRSYQSLATECDRFVGFELGEMFLPFGRIYSLEVYRELMNINQCIGAKHSSLQRQPEWDRLALRDKVRPDFLVLTGNDLAIDMVMYGSDYLLGLSSFCPDLFGLRDRMWESGDADFLQLNDVLQYLGFYAFRAPVPAYKHSCAQFLHLREMLKTNETHPNGQPRETTDLEVLGGILEQLQPWL